MSHCFCTCLLFLFCFALLACLPFLALPCLALPCLLWLPLLCSASAVLCLCFACLCDYMEASCLKFCCWQCAFQSVNGTCEGEPLRFEAEVGVRIVRQQCSCCNPCCRSSLSCGFHGHEGLKLLLIVSKLPPGLLMVSKLLVGLIAFSAQGLLDDASLHHPSVGNCVSNVMFTRPRHTSPYLDHILGRS